ncbi:MAG: monophosphatase [Frankiaceae bacterium]|nr:monophosphatase [Frankiaceae bacterium]
MIADSHEHDYADLLDIATDLARAAGTLLRNRPSHLGAGSKSTPTDAVTDMDRAAERLILDGLATRRPGDGVLAEESGAHDGGAVTWVVDPLDGTVNYLYRIPQYAVSIAARVGAEVVAGAVYDVARDNLYAATLGGGATCDGTPLRSTTQSDPALALVATGFGYAATLRAAQARVLATVLPRIRDIRRFGSAALDLCAVASGQVDAYFEAGMQPWDWSAGGLIASEAGAAFGGLAGRPPGRWTTLAANPTLFAAMDQLLIAAGADELPVSGAGDDGPRS